MDGIIVSVDSIGSELDEEEEEEATRSSKGVAVLEFERKWLDVR